MSENFRQIAALTLAKCAAYDPYLTEPTVEQAVAWAEQIELYKLGLDDMLAAVKKVYSQQGSGYRPLPKDLTDAAREIRRDRAERETDTEREARQDRRDAELERNRARIEAMVRSVTATTAIPR